MAEEDKYECLSEVGLFVCAGGSNVGIMSVKAAVAISEKLGRGKVALLCLPGISDEVGLEGSIEYIFKTINNPGGIY